MCVCEGGRRGKVIPVRMFWNASSTLLASKAEVSMNERLLSPAPVSPLYSLVQQAVRANTNWQTASPPPSAPPSNASNHSYSPPT